MKTPADYFYIGLKDGLACAPKQKGMNKLHKACYENGYKEGHQQRSKAKKETK